MVSKFLIYISNFEYEYEKVIERLFGYLKYINNMILFYNNFSSILEGNMDINWISNLG